MRKFVTALTGGVPVHGERLNVELGAELWDPIQAIMSRFDSDAEGVIVKGCTLSPNGGNFDITAGIVYLNGEFMRVAAATNVAFPSFIQPTTPTTIQKEFGDGVLKNLIEQKLAGLSGSAPGAGQYIALYDFTTRRRWDEWGKYDSIQFLIDGGGTTILTGSQGFQAIGYDCEIMSVQMYAEPAGAAVVDLYVDTYANFPAVVGDKITASAPPTITATTDKSQDTTLTGWSKNLLRGKHIRYNVNSVTSITRLTLVLNVKRI